MGAIKLYELTRGDKFKIANTDEAFTLVRLDGMYSICHDKNGNTVHLICGCEVEKEDIK